MRTNFTECAIRYTSNQSLIDRWHWNGTILGLERNFSTQISREGCISLCGDGIDLYPWSDASSTITTWVLPVIGTLLQAPFESNAFRRTVWAITRWVGSPIASLSYVLWNIKVSAKAALMVDMAVPYDQYPERQSHFGSMRDSMYLLLAMTQYTMNPTAIKQEKEAERLLRIALFSKDLQLTDTDQKLWRMRRTLARELREMRRRGVVPGECDPASICASPYADSWQSSCLPSGFYSHLPSVSKQLSATWVRTEQHMIWPLAAYWPGSLSSLWAR